MSMPWSAAVVLNGLRHEPQTASAIGHSLRLPHETVYLGLVWLEARGYAYVRAISGTNGERQAWVMESREAA